MIFFVRHGETNYNLQGKMQGRADIPLNQKGINQANETAEKLKDKNIDIIYSSPLSRAKQTAEIINKYHNKEIILDERIIEIELGQLTGALKTKEILNSLPNKDFTQKYNAEDFNDFFERCSQFYNSIKDDNKNILIVSHSGVGLQLKRHLNLNEKEIVQNCEIVVLKGDKDE